MHLISGNKTFYLHFHENFTRLKGEIIQVSTLNKIPFGYVLIVQCPIIQMMSFYVNYSITWMSRELSSAGVLKLLGSTFC